MSLISCFQHPFPYPAMLLNRCSTEHNMHPSAGHINTFWNLNQKPKHLLLWPDGKIHSFLLWRFNLKQIESAKNENLSKALDTETYYYHYRENTLPFLKINCPKEGLQVPWLQITHFKITTLKTHFMLYVPINLEMPPQCPHLTVGHNPTLKNTLLIDNSGPAWEKIPIITKNWNNDPNIRHYLLLQKKFVSNLI